MITLFFILGLIIGSFLNVLVCRLKESETLLGRSFCRSCKTQIRFYDNIPLLSFLLLGGKCRDCHAPISYRYPLLELVTALLFVLVGKIFFVPDDTVAFLQTGWLLMIVSLFLAIAVYDMMYMEIPVSLLIASFLVTLTYFALSLALGLSSLSWGERSVVTDGLLGGLAIALFFFALVYASKETWMGWGDVWLGGVAGMVVGLPAIFFFLTLSFGLGALIGVMLMLRQKKSLKSQIPFAPYLVLGTFLVLFLPYFFPLLKLWFLPL